MKNSILINFLESREIAITLEHILENSKADSGGERDLNFFKYLIDQRLLLIKNEVILKRTNLNASEEYYLDRYKKGHFESDRHFLCRTIIQDELNKLGIKTESFVDIGNMSILRSNSNYDIALADFSATIDIGLTPARNYFRGLTDLRIKNYLITSYFDDYNDDVIFSNFTRGNDDDFINAIKDYEDGFKLNIPFTSQQQPDIDNPAL